MNHILNCRGDGHEADTVVLLLTIALVAISAVFYLIQVTIFHRTEDTFFYMLQDIAFVPVQVLLVTLFLNQLLTMREKRALLKR